MNTDSPALLCDDSTLGYRRSHQPVAPGEKLILDASYRLAHLPLVNPSHPDVIPSVAGKTYTMGRHDPVHSVVLPVSADSLESALPFQVLQEALRHSPLGSKLAWDLMALRRQKLHATLCGSLDEREAASLCDPDFRAKLKEIGPFVVEMRGLFSGNLNIGRLYLKAYPENRNGQNMIHCIQRLMGRKETDLYLVGLHNLMDHLDPEQTRWLFERIEEWWDRPILRFTVRELWLLSSMDDLVLDSRIEERFDLGAG